VRASDACSQVTSQLIEQLTRQLRARLGAGAISEVSNGTVTVDVPPQRWTEALWMARHELACDRFDWLSAVDELADGFAIVAHVYSVAGPRHLLLRTRVRHGAPRLPTAAGIYPAAARHERETARMCGVVFDGHPDPSPPLLPDISE
jgi:NADH-quinone oxidoreductase subunit C